MTRTRIFLLYLLVLLAAAFIHSPALHAPWQGGELELFDSPVYPLKNMSAKQIFQKAPGEFLGYWSLAFQARHAPSPFAFRLVNLVLILFSLSLIFILALFMTRTSKEHPLLLLFLFALIAFHPYITELISNSEARGALLAFLLGALSAGLLFLGIRIENKFSFIILIMGIILYSFALFFHFIAILTISLFSGIQLRKKDHSLSINEKRGLITGILLVLLSIIYTFSLRYGPGLLNSHAKFGLDFNLVALWVSILPIKLPMSLGEKTIFLICFIFFYFISALFLFTRGNRNKVSNRKIGNYIIFIINLFLISFVLYIENIFSAYILGLIILFIFLFMLSMIPLNGQLQSMRKALAGIFAVVILLLFGGLSFNHANLKQHDIISSRNFIEVKPGKGYMWLDLAQSYLAHSQPELAETALHKVQAVSTENEKNILLLKIELAKGNLIVARGLFDEYISAGLDEDTRKLYKCQLSAREGDLEGAEEQCGHDFSDPTMKAAALNQLGALYLKKGNEWDGEMALRRAYESDRFYPGVLTNLGFLFERQDKKDEALGFYMRSVRIDPFSIIARRHAARILHGQGKFSEQVRLLEEIIRINPYEIEAHANLALTLILKFKKPDEARFHLEEALRLAPDSPMAAELMRLGQYYYSLQSD